VHLINDCGKNFTISDSEKAYTAEKSAWYTQNTEERNVQEFVAYSTMLDCGLKRIIQIFFLKLTKML
jgi:hypothetical protein